MVVPLPGGEVVVIAVFPAGAMLAEGAGDRLLPVATLLAQVADAGRRRRRIAPRRWMVVAAVAAVPALLAALPRAAVVEAPVVLRPEHVRTVTTPFEGILEASAVQPGDAVVQGVTPLARLGTREVELELAAARARAANDLRDAAVARAAGQPAQEQISLLSARRAEAQVALLEHRLRLADIRAPAVLVLDEDSTAVREGQPVRFATAAEPGLVREAVVERVRPMAEVVQGRNAFRVIARLAEGDVEGLRPGMEGWARIETGRTNWLAALLRDPVRWVRRRVWL